MRGAWDDGIVIDSRPPAQGELLVASVGLGAGLFFEQSVVLLLDVNDGALGVTLNKQTHTEVASVLAEWAELVTPPAFLFSGGPLSPGGAVCLAQLANADEDPPGWGRVVGSTGLLQMDTPIELVRGCYTDLRIFAGYSGWGPGQLEDELAKGLWFRMAAREADVFGADPHGLWRRLLRRRGGHVGLLSTWADDPGLN